MNLNNKNRNKNEYTTILAIDTSCDDTSVAVTHKNRVIANIISSQDEIHNKWGGVVPDLARRAHNERIDYIVKEALLRAKRSDKNFSRSSIDAVAVTHGPGLAIALEVGITKAKELANELSVPLIAVNHMEGHLLSSLAANSKGKAPVEVTKDMFPLLGLLISGGHTEIILVKDFGKYEKIAEKMDDAIGEAYDKVARMLGLGYPGGRVLTEIAKKGDPEGFQLPVPLEKDPRLAFSYSGLKTAVYYRVKSMEEKQGTLTKKQIEDMAASFEKSAIRHLQIMLSRAIKEHKPKMVLLGGGVVASPKVRIGIRQVTRKNLVPMYYPYSQKLFKDNAAMIGVAAYYSAHKHGIADDGLDRNPRADLSDLSISTK